MESTMSPYFGIVVSLAAFGIGTFLFKKTKGFFLFTPLFVAMVLGIAFLKIGGFSYADYNNGGEIIKFFLEPATIAFAIPLYKQRDKIKKYWWQIMASIIAGSICSVTIVYLLAKGIHLDSTRNEKHASAGGYNGNCASFIKRHRGHQRHHSLCGHL